MPDILPPVVPVNSWADIRRLADDAVDDLMERLGEDDPPVDIGEVPQLLRDTAARITTLLSMIGHNVKG